MLDRVHAHPLLPDQCELVFSKSPFGGEVGFAHCIDTSTSKEDVYYLALILEDKHAGAPGRGHGAVTLAMLDEAMGRAASQTVDKLCFTVSMTTNFCSGSKIGEFLVAEAHVQRKGKSMVFVEAKLHGETALIATASGVFANSGIPIPKRGDLTPEAQTQAK